MLKSPCKNCEDRVVGCHANCKSYIDWAKEHNEAKEKDRKEKIVDFAIRKVRRKRWKL